MRDLLSGAALGALVGLLVGMATTGVVGTVVGALVALLASFFALQGGGGPLPAAAPLRVLGFSAVAVVGLLAGVYLRASDGFAPGLEERSRAWQAAGFSQKEAAELIAFERLGIVRGEWRAPENAIAAARERTTQASTALFSGEAADACGTLGGRDYPSAQAYLDAFRAEGGPWERFADAMPENLSEADRMATFTAALALVCE